MPIETKRNKGESFEAFMRRTKQTWMRSGQILQARKVRYVQDKKSKNVQKNQAVQYAQKQSKEEYLRKIGKMPPLQNKFGRRR